MWLFTVGVFFLVAGAYAEDKTVTVGNYSTKVKGQSGKIAVFRNANESDGVTVAFDALEEIDTTGSTIKSGHSYNNFAQLEFTFSTLTNTTYQDSNVSVTQFNFTSTIPVETGKTATLTSYVFIFTSDGNITVDGHDLEVKTGEMKFNAEIKNWPFCGANGVTCTQGQTSQTGQYLDFSVEIKGKKAPEKSNNTNVAGQYDLGDGAKVVVPSQVKYDSNNNTKAMPTGYPKVIEKDSRTVFVFRFETFNTSALYDPVVSVTSNASPDGGDNTTTGQEQTVSASGVSAKVLGHSGKIELMNSGSTGDSSKNRIVVEFDNLQEMTMANTSIKDTAHRFQTFANQQFTFGTAVDEMYPGTTIGVKKITFQSTLTNAATLKVYLYVFKSGGEITQENETTEVKAGNVKFTVEISSWTFCSGTNCQAGEVGEYLDFDIVMKGTGSSKKVAGEKYDLGGGFVMLSRKIKINDGSDLVDMVTGYPLMTIQGSKQIFRFRFPKFSTKVMYDPTFSLLPDNGSGTEQTVSASGVSAKVLGQSGKIELMNNGSTGVSGKNTIVVEFDKLQEMTLANKSITNHSFQNFANQQFTFGSAVDEMYPGTTIGVKKITFQSTLTNAATLKVYLYVFKSGGVITQENETTEVEAGNVKFTVEIYSWTFCRKSDCQAGEVGEYLDFDIVMKGTGSSKKVAGEKYDLGGGSVILSKKIKIDDGSDLVDMVTGYPLMTTQGNKQIFRFRFPKFSTNVMYDPTFSLLPDNGSGTARVTVPTMLLAAIGFNLQRM